MNTATIAYPHIAFNSEVRNGKPVIEGSRVAVQDIVEYFGIYHDVARIQRALPDLSISEIYSALAYYHDHKKEIDCAIEQSKDVSRLKSLGIRIFDEENSGSGK
jgi:uncharacterized protein (DUF433 family)